MSTSGTAGTTSEPPIRKAGLVLVGFGALLIGGLGILSFAPTRHSEGFSVDC
jgi:hypothetical protein